MEELHESLRLFSKKQVSESNSEPFTPITSASYQPSLDITGKQAQQLPENRLGSRHDQEHHNLALYLQTVQICFASAVSNAALTVQDHLTFSNVSAVL